MLCSSVHDTDRYQSVIILVKRETSEESHFQATDIYEIRHESFLITQKIHF